MGGWNGVYTKKGLALLAKLTQGSSLNITRAVTGTGVVDDESLPNQTAVSNIKQTLSFQNATYPEPGKCKLPMFLTNDGVGAGYTAHQIGLYATDPNEGEILYFIAQSTNGTDVPALSEVTGYVATWTFYFQYGQADNVTVVVDPSNAVTIDMLEEVRILAERGVSTPKIGTAVTFDDSAELPFAGLSIYGKSTQEGTPSPSTPIDIANLGDSGNIKATICGRNLVNPLKITQGTNDSLNISENGYKIEVTGSVAYCNSKVWFPSTIKGQTIIVKYDSEAWVNKGQSDTTMQLAYTRGSTTSYHPLSASMRQISVSIPADAKDIYLAIQPNNTNAALETAASLTIYGLMVCIADNNDLAWVESKEWQTVTLTTPNGLPGIPVSSGGNFTDTTGQQWICDEIDLVRGVYIQRIAVETCTFSYDDTNGRYNATLSNYANTNCAEGTAIPVICNKLEYNQNAGAGSPTKTNGIRVAATSPKYVIAYYNGDAIDSATVYYPLATPIETALTDEAYKALTANNPYTTVFNSDGANMLVDCIRDVNENAFSMVLNHQTNNITNNTESPTSTTITVADGMEYRYETAITALNVTYPSGNFECWIKFKTGTTFTLTLPSTTTYIGSIPDFAASTWYELSIKDGVAIFGEVGAGT